jgi:hypothetical protein
VGNRELSVKMLVIRLSEMSSLIPLGIICLLASKRPVLWSDLAVFGSVLHVRLLITLISDTASVFLP